MQSLLFGQSLEHEVDLILCREQMYWYALMDLRYKFTANLGELNLETSKHPVFTHRLGVFSAFSRLRRERGARTIKGDVTSEVRILGFCFEYIMPLCGRQYGMQQFCFRLTSSTTMRSLALAKAGKTLGTVDRSYA